VVIFAAGALLVSGGFAVVQGLVALLKEDLLQLRERPVLIDLATWGWVNLVFGAVQVAAAFALLVGARWARLVAVLVAGVSAVVQMLYLPHYPLSAIVVLGLDLLVIWAVVVHGRDIRTS
jgi:hypothetical protein